MAKERMYDSGVPAAVGAKRRSSRQINEFLSQPRNHRPDDRVPAAIAATRRTSKQINSQLGHAENHRADDFNTVARGAKPAPQVVKGRTHSHPTKFGDSNRGRTY